MSQDDTRSRSRYPGLLGFAAVKTFPKTLLLLLLLLALAPPAWAARRSLIYKLPPDTVEGLTFEATHRVQTEFVELPPEAEPYDTDALFASLADVSTTVSGRMERVVARVFRDRSLGLVTRFIDLEGTVDRGEQAVPAPLDGLEGKSGSLRVLDSGEVLAGSGWQHIAGARRGGDLVRSVLLQSVLRLPFMVPANGGALPTRFRLRVPLEPLVNLDQDWDIAYREGTPPADCKRCVALDYEGTVKEVAEDRHPARPMNRESTAEVSGTIVLDKRGLLQSHSFSLAWTHEVQSLRENETPRAQVRQLHAVDGVIRAEVGR